MFETQSEDRESLSVLRRWIPLIASILLTPIIIVMVGITSMEGDLIFAKLVFPIPLALGAALYWVPESVPPFAASALNAGFIGLFILQFPIYGLILSLSKRRDLAIVVLVGVHLISSFLAFLLSGLTGLRQ